MSNRIDQLFKSKLGEHSLPPSEESWAKVQAGLSKKNSVIIYWRAAAAVALLGLLVSAWYLFNQSTITEQQQLSQSGTTETIIQQPEIKQEPKTDQKQALDLTGKKKADIKKQSKRSLHTPVAQDLAVKVDVSEHNEEQKTMEQLPEVNESIALVQEVNQEKAVVIEFVLPTIVETNTSEMAVAAIEDEKSTGIIKLLETARDVKNGDAEFSSSLRDMKNELFAFDFKKDKTKRN
jgi:hypothetical protein